jgi:hypothetical protein
MPGLIKAYDHVALEFKGQKQLLEFESDKLNPKLKAIILDVAQRVREIYGMTLMVTCVISGQGEHPSGRAVDIRCKHFTLEVAVIGIQNYVLDMYPRNNRITTRYGKEREFKSCHIHGEGPEIHAHISVED